MYHIRLLAFLVSAISSSLLWPSSAVGSYESFASLKTWAMEETTDTILNAQVCRAYGPIISQEDAGVELSVNLPKDTATLPAIVVRTHHNPAWVKVHIGSKVRAVLLPLHRSTGPTDPNVYWYAPVDFQVFKDKIAEAYTAEVILESADPATPIQLSLRGSANAIAEAQKCSAKWTPTVAEFFKFLAADPGDLQPGLGDKSVQLLFKTTQEAFTAFGKSTDLESALQAVRKPFAALLKKEARALSQLESSRAESLRADQALSVKRSELSSAEQDLSLSLAEQADLQTQKSAAEAHLAIQKTEYQLRLTQMQSANSEVANANKAVESQQKRIQEQQDLIPRNRDKIRRLENERSGLRRSLPDLRNQAQSLRHQYDQAQGDYQRYNPSWEYERLLDRDWSYRSAKSDLSSLQRELSFKQRELWPYESEVNDLRRELDRCRRERKKEKKDGKEVESPIDCSPIKDRLEAAQRRLNRASLETRRLENEIERVEFTIRNSEQSARRVVDQEVSRLSQRARDLESQMFSKQNEVSNYESRISDIDSTIPSLLNQISRAEAALPTLRSDLVQLQNDLELKIRTRDELGQKIGFPQAEKNYLAAKAEFEAIQQRLKELAALIPKVERTIRHAKRDLTQLEQDSERKAKSLQEAEQNLNALQAELQVLREQEAPLKKELEVSQQQQNGLRAKFQLLYDGLVASIP